MITHVAIRFDGRIWSLPRPYRHHHIIWTIVRLSDEFKEYTKDDFDSVDTHGKDQGFLDETGKYLTREEAYIVARDAGQLRPDREVYNERLYSENVW